MYIVFVNLNVNEAFTSLVLQWAFSILKHYETHHLLTGFLSVHKSSWNDIGCEQLVTLAEFLEDDSVGEALPADTDTF